MKVFSFMPTNSLKRAYNGLILRYRRYDTTVEFLKVGFLVAVLMLAGFVYLFYVNMASTRGYFLRQENQKLSAVSFDFEILKTKLLEYKLANREAIQSVNSRREVVNVKAEVVKIP